VDKGVIQYCKLIDSRVFARPCNFVEGFGNYKRNGERLIGPLFHTPLFWG